MQDDDLHAWHVAGVDSNTVSSPPHAAQANDLSPDHAIGAISFNMDPFVFPTKILGEFDFSLSLPLLRNLDSLRRMKTGNVLWKTRLGICLSNHRL